jgi:hypothetical protein
LKAIIEDLVAKRARVLSKIENLTAAIEQRFRRFQHNRESSAAAPSVVLHILTSGCYNLLYNQYRSSRANFVSVNKMILDLEGQHASVVVVLGVHRGGTSVVTRALSALSVNIGYDLMPATSDNLKGYFEDREINLLNIELLDAMGCSWRTLIVPETPSELTEKFSRHARVLIGERFAASSIWAFKDPRVTRLLPFWQHVLTEAGFRVVYALSNRHPLSVADSLAKRDGMPRGQALGLWLMYQVSGLRAVLRNGGIVVDYDLMLQDPEAQLRRLSSFLGLRCETPKLQAFTNGFLDRNLCHSSYARDGSDFKTDGIESVCGQLYFSLSALAEADNSIPDALRVGCLSALQQCEDYLKANEEWLKAIDVLQEETKDVPRLHNVIAQKNERIRNLERRRLSARIRLLFGLQGRAGN